MCVSHWLTLTDVLVASIRSNRSLVVSSICRVRTVEVVMYDYALSLLLLRSLRAYLKLTAVTRLAFHEDLRSMR
jgi:hypothetical protein